MRTMTWKEFKEYIDSEIKRKGITEDAKIEYIDISYPNLGHESRTPYVACDKDGLVVHT